MFTNADILDLNNGNSFRPEKLLKYGNKVGRGICVYDPTANESQRAVAAHTLSLLIPKDSFVRACYNVQTTFTSAGDTATIALHVAGANDLVSAVAINNGGNPWDTSSALVATIADEDPVNWVQVTADSYITATVAVQALTAGKLIVFAEWYCYAGL